MATIDKQELRIGQQVHKGTVGHISVGPHEKVTIYGGPALGTKPISCPFLVGEYGDQGSSWLYGKWLQHDGHKLIVVETTGFAPNELIEFRWMRKARNGHPRYGTQKFEPSPDGGYQARSEVFPNDTFEHVVIPKNATANIYDGYGLSRSHVVLQEGTHNLADYDLANRVSSFEFELDEWEMIGADYSDELKNRVKL